MFVLIFLYINLSDQIVNDFFCNYFRCLGAASTSPSKMALWSRKCFPTAFFSDILFSWDILRNYTDLLLRPIHFGNITQSMLYICDFLSLDLGKKMALYRPNKNVQRVLKTAPNGNLIMFAPQENYLFLSSRYPQASQYLIHFQLWLSSLYFVTNYKPRYSICVADASVDCKKAHINIFSTCYPPNENCTLGAVASWEQIILRHMNVTDS